MRRKPQIEGGTEYEYNFERRTDVHVNAEEKSAREKLLKEVT